MKKTLLITLQVFFFYQISAANNVGNFEENDENCSFFYQKGLIHLHQSFLMARILFNFVMVKLLLFYQQLLRMEFLELGFPQQ